MFFHSSACDVSVTSVANEARAEMDLQGAKGVP